jgi:hypothetical protein
MELEGDGVPVVQSGIGRERAACGHTRIGRQRDALILVRCRGRDSGYVIHPGRPYRQIVAMKTYSHPLGDLIAEPRKACAIAWWPKQMPINLDLPRALRRKPMRSVIQGRSS